MEPDLPLLEAYLGALHAELAAEPLRERVVSEAEDHLRETIAQRLAAGASRTEAQQQAIERFGSAPTVAAAFLRLRGQPRVFDARRGLPEPALEELRQATRVSLAIKDGATAVLGYWVPEPVTGRPADERFGDIIVRRRDWRPNLGTTAEFEPVHVEVARDKRWQRFILPELHTGMQLQVESWSGQLRLWLGPISGGLAQGTQIHLVFPPGRHLRSRR
jgi:hypothetical protein